MDLSIVTPPASEPVSTSEAKAHCRIDISTDDSLVGYLISSARRFCENYCQRGFINQTWKLSYDISDFDPCTRVIRLPFGTVQSITNIKTYDSENNPTTLDTSYYRLSHDRIVLNDGYEWPALDRMHDSMEITYVVGYGSSASNVPQDIRQAILMTIAHQYENREAVIDPISPNDKQSIMLPMGVAALLVPYRIFAV